MLPDEGCDVKEDMALHSYALICIDAWNGLLDMLMLHWKLLGEVTLLCGDVHCGMPLRSYELCWLHCIHMHIFVLHTLLHFLEIMLTDL